MCVVLPDIQCNDVPDIQCILMILETVHCTVHVSWNDFTEELRGFFRTQMKKRQLNR